MEKISTDYLSGNALEFACLFNALADAGYSDSWAADMARDVVSGGLNIKCNCK